MRKQIEKICILNAVTRVARDGLRFALCEFIDSLRTHPTSELKDLSKEQQEVAANILYVAQVLVSIDYNLGRYRQLIAAEQRELGADERRKYEKERIGRERNVIVHLENLFSEFSVQVVDTSVSME
ncbi:MAG: hypothetical protein NT003_03835 [Candidatus Magasanikbacteria bacterium]|nr:hypothetical protein [Candidatus Magasanikbacteria bacterium]